MRVTGILATVNQQVRLYLHHIDHYRRPGILVLSPAHKQNCLVRIVHTNAQSHYQINHIQVTKKHFVNKSLSVKLSVRLVFYRLFVTFLILRNNKCYKNIKSKCHVITHALASKSTFRTR